MVDFIGVFDKFKYEHLVKLGFTHYLKIRMYVGENSKRVYYLVPFKSESAARLYAFDVNMFACDYNVELLDQYAEEIACGVVTSCEFFLWDFGL